MMVMVMMLMVPLLLLVFQVLFAIVNKFDRELLFISTQQNADGSRLQILHKKHQNICLIRFYCREMQICNIEQRFLGSP